MEALVKLSAAPLADVKKTGQEVSSCLPGKSLYLLETASYANLLLLQTLLN